MSLSLDPPVPVDLPAWNAVFEAPASTPFRRALADWIGRQRWFRQKSMRITGLRLSRIFPLPETSVPACVAVVEVESGSSAPTSYVVPFAYLRGHTAEAFARARPGAVILPVAIRHEGRVERGQIVDALEVEPVLSALLTMFAGAIKAHADGQTLAFHRTSTPIWSAAGSLEPRVLGREQTNTSVAFGERYICKILRKLDDEPSVDLEVGHFLTDVNFRHAPALAGYAEMYREPLGHHGPARTFALLHEHIANKGDAWTFARRALARHLEASRRGDASVVCGLRHDATLFRLLGQRTGELHAALASRPADPVFGLQPLDAKARQALSLDAQASFSSLIDRLRRNDARACATLEGLREQLHTRLDRVSFLTDAGAKLRVHGDLHLGQVLYTGADFFFIDFEGEPARSTAERRARRSPFVDIAGMLRSIDYARASVLRESQPAALSEAETALALWRREMSTAYLEGWLAVADGAGILPASAEDRHALLDFCLLEKCIYEVGYELDHRPDWLAIPLAGLAALLAEDTGRS